MLRAAPVPRTTTAFPAPSATAAFGPQGVYGYRYVVKKVYSLSVRRDGAHSKRLGYHNAYSQPLRLSLHTDCPSLVSLPKLLYVIPPQQRESLRLKFEPKPRAMAENTAQIRLWVHNELTDTNEECLVFNVSYLTDFEASMAAR
eukprot:COSAG01_NODE_3508_length_5989_cov_5.088115_4_plen_144_part_00